MNTIEERNRSGGSLLAGALVAMALGAALAAGDAAAMGRTDSDVRATEDAELAGGDRQAGAEAGQASRGEAAGTRDAERTQARRDEAGAGTTVFDRWRYNRQ